MLFMAQKFEKISHLLDVTGKSLSEELILASTNPQYDNRLFIELQVQNKKTIRCVHKLFSVFVLPFRTINVYKIVVFMY